MLDKHTCKCWDFQNQQLYFEISYLSIHPSRCQSLKWRASKELRIWQCCQKRLASVSGTFFFWLLFHCLYLSVCSLFIFTLGAIFTHQDTSPIRKQNIPQSCGICILGSTKLSKKLHFGDTYQTKNNGADLRLSELKTENKNIPKKCWQQKLQFLFGGIFFYGQVTCECAPYPILLFVFVFLFLLPSMRVCGATLCSILLLVYNQNSGVGHSW